MQRACKCTPFRGLPRNAWSTLILSGRELALYSRFLVWQNNPYKSIDTQAGDENVVRLADIAVDVRFCLKGYGFKRVGEKNRLVHHFGTYKCFYRKVGDPLYTLFANAQSERNDTEADTVYKDIAVAVGKLAEGNYEFKIVANKLSEYLLWGGGVVEGIGAGDVFYYNLSARNHVSPKVRVSNNISIKEFSGAGANPFYVSGGSDDAIQSLETVHMDLETKINVSSVVALTDGVALSVA